MNYRLKIRQDLEKLDTTFLEESEPISLESEPISGLPYYNSEKLPVTWTGDFNLPGAESTDGHEFASEMAYYNKVRLFPKSRDKDKSKRNHKFSSFSKLWQRQFSKFFFRSLTIQFHWLYNKLNNLGRGHRLRGMVLKSNYFDYRYKFWTLWNRSLFGFLMRHFCQDIKLAIALIFSGSIYLNGVSTTNPFAMVSKLSIVKVNIPVFYFVIFDMLRFKLHERKPFIFVNKLFFRKFAPSTSTEFSFKLSEIFTLSLPYSDRESKRSFMELYYSPGILFSQRFFPQQKGFGVGRLI